jgi:hypothetical protein
MEITELSYAIDVKIERLIPLSEEQERYEQMFSVLPERYTTKAKKHFCMDCISGMWDYLKEVAENVQE